jgi:putative prophage protein (ps3)
VIIIGGVVNMTTLFEVAKNFLERDPSMSLKKLQKLCWYAYSWFIALNNEPNDSNLELLFDGYAEAWVHGPVFRELYFDVRHDNRNKLNSADLIDDPEIVEFLDEVYRVYGSFTGNDLESITHQEYPWKNAREDLKPSVPSTRRINNRDIFQEYLDRN